MFGPPLVKTNTVLTTSTNTVQLWGVRRTRCKESRFMVDNKNKMEIWRGGPILGTYLSSAEPPVALVTTRSYTGTARYTELLSHHKQTFKSISKTA